MAFTGYRVLPLTNLLGWRSLWDNHWTQAQLALVQSTLASYVKQCAPSPDGSPNGFTCKDNRADCSTNYLTFYSKDLDSESPLCTSPPFVGRLWVGWTTAVG